jgi:Tfp pilus assembly protein PilV
MQRNVLDRVGLTLVEVLLALLIITVAFLITMQTFGRGLFLHQQVVGESRAVLVAQSQMDALLRDSRSLGVSLSKSGTFPEKPEPVDGSLLGLEESAVDGYTWQVTVAAHESQPGLREVTLRLIWMERGRERHIELVSLAS